MLGSLNLDYSPLVLDWVTEADPSEIVAFLVIGHGGVWIPSCGVYSGAMESDSPWHEAALRRVDALRRKLGGYQHLAAVCGVHARSVRALPGRAVVVLSRNEQPSLCRMLEAWRDANPTKREVEYLGFRAPVDRTPRERLEQLLDLHDGLWLPSQGVYAEHADPTDFENLGEYRRWRNFFHDGSDVIAAKSVGFHAVRIRCYPGGGEATVVLSRAEAPLRSRVVDAWRQAEPQGFWIRYPEDAEPVFPNSFTPDSFDELHVLGANLSRQQMAAMGQERLIRTLMRIANHRRQEVADMVDSWGSTAERRRAILEGLGLFGLLWNDLGEPVVEFDRLETTYNAFRSLHPELPEYDEWSLPLRALIYPSTAGHGWWAESGEKLRREWIEFVATFSPTK